MSYTPTPEHITVAAEAFANHAENESPIVAALNAVGPLIYEQGYTVGWREAHHITGLDYHKGRRDALNEAADTLAEGPLVSDPGTADWLRARAEAGDVHPAGESGETVNKAGDDQ